MGIRTMRQERRCTCVSNHVCDYCAVLAVMPVDPAIAERISAEATLPLSLSQTSSYAQEARAVRFPNSQRDESMPYVPAGTLAHRSKVVAVRPPVTSSRSKLITSIPENRNPLHVNTLPAFERISDDGAALGDDTRPVASNHAAVSRNSLIAKGLIRSKRNPANGSDHESR